MRLGIIGAMEEEIALLLHDISTESKLEAAGRAYYSGRLYGSDVVLVFSRWGKVASASTTATLLSEFDIGAVVFAGVAGAVSKDLRIGDVVVASELLQHDLDVRPLFEQFAIPILGVKRLQADPLLTQAAVRAAESWLALVDGGKYDASWDQAAALFKAAVTREQWRQSLTAARKPLGANKSRKLKSATYKTELPGAPDGEYVVIQFEASFASKKNAVETITPMKDKDGVWRVSGYYIK